MVDSNPGAVAPRLPEGVMNVGGIQPVAVEGCRLYKHYDGATHQLRTVCAGMALLEPGASPHPPHRHPEEEFLIVSEGTGEIECDGKVTQVGPGLNPLLARQHAARHYQYRKDADDVLLVEVAARS